MTTIPISQIVNMSPGVVDAGGAESRLSGVVISQDDSLSPGLLYAFYDSTTVGDQFGTDSPEYAMATRYFGGIVNADQLPYVLYFMREVTAAEPARVLGARLSGLTLVKLKALTGTLVVTTDSVQTSSAIDLSAATDFISAARIMQAAFTSPDFTIVWDGLRERFVVATTGTGTSASMAAVTGTLADSVGLSAGAGATLQATGYAVDTPDSVMTRVVGISTNWGAFALSCTAPVEVRLAYAAWVSGQHYQYLYAAHGKDASDKVTDNAASFGNQVMAGPVSNVLPLWGDHTMAAVALCYAASINFDVTNGRMDFAFRTPNVLPNDTISTLAEANALLSNGVSYLGDYSNPANTYTILFDGAISGIFSWVDTYLDQIWLNRETQRAIFECMVANKSLPYNADGYAAVYEAIKGQMEVGVTNGVIRPGVTLSATQIQTINTAAGVKITDKLYSAGWYAQVSDPANAAQTRQNRTSPQVKIWYCDGGSIHHINPIVKTVM